jgi:hypothetical protein
MDPQKTFSMNLRKECSRFKSIAEICRGTNINRQQFNKYLAGDHLPNPRTRRKICEFLGVEEAQMFLMLPSPSAVRPDTQRSTPSIRALSSQVTSIATMLQHFGYDSIGSSAAIRPGFYACYFPLQGIPGMLVRTIVKIKKLESLTSFVRHTSFSSIRFPNRRLAKNRHSGLVLTKAGLTYLIGMKSDEPHHFSYLVFNNNTNFGKDIFVGLGTTQGNDGPISSCVCLEYRGKSISSAKETARSLGVIKISDSSVPFPVSSVFQTQPEALAGQLGLPRVEDASFVAAMLPMMQNLPDLEQKAKFSI